MGGLPEMVTHGHDGLLFASPDVSDLRSCVAALSEDAALAERMGMNGHDRLLASNTGEIHYLRLVEAYEAAQTRRTGSP
jgi:glycosyltransferase involved in cell wall biosynthesis